jgi:hypothetical protein
VLWEFSTGDNELIKKVMEEEKMEETSNPFGPAVQSHTNIYIELKPQREAKVPDVVSRDYSLTQAEFTHTS